MKLPAIDPHVFRTVMSHFATGVVVVTGRDDRGEPAGMTAQSFSSLSLDPPLVMVSPARSSTSWPKIGPQGLFAINVLAADQAGLSGAFAQSGGDKFADTAWHEGELGVPLLDGALAHIECTLEAVYPGGDHIIVVGKVAALHTDFSEAALEPLVFYRSAYRTLGAQPPTIP